MFIGDEYVLMKGPVNQKTIRKQFSEAWHTLYQCDANTFYILMSV